MTDIIGDFKGKHRFLSNFYEREFYVPSLTLRVPTAEHAFQAFKTKSKSERLHVLRAKTPKEAKKRGQEVTMRKGWERGVRVEAMRFVLLAKFRDKELEELLLATNSALLIEYNVWHDNFWGHCVGPCEHVKPGQNMLGELLMARRAALRGL